MFVSIVLQSLPFLLLGVLASTLVQQALSPQVTARWIPRRRMTAILLGSLSGLIVPVCDCGVVPLARRLTTKGVPVYAVLSFMLAAPVVNPIVLIATVFAFQGNAGVALLRAGMTLSVAISVGVLASLLFPGPKLVLPGLRAVLEHDSDEDDDAPESRGWSKIASALQQASGEFFEIVFFIVLGALFTAATQTFVPRGDLAALGTQPVGSVVALMPAASLLSICSEADAFVARAFATSFSPGAVLAFMTIGQIVDLRNGFLLVRTLGVRLAGLIVGTGYALVLLEGVGINALVGPT